MEKIIKLFSLFIVFNLIVSCSSTPDIVIVKPDKKVIKKRKLKNKIDKVLFSDNKEEIIKVVDELKEENFFEDNLDFLKEYIKQIVFFNKVDLFIILFKEKKIIEDLNSLDEKDNSFIIDSAKHEDLTLFKEILDLGGKPINKGSFDRNILHIALDGDNSYLIDIAIKFKIDPFSKGFMNKDPLDYNLSKENKIKLLEYRKLFRVNTLD